jgi:hypothetical protein
LTCSSSFKFWRQASKSLLACSLEMPYFSCILPTSGHVCRELVEVIVRKFAPSLLKRALYLLPFTLNLIPIHVYLQEMLEQPACHPALKQSDRTYK